MRIGFISCIFILLFSLNSSYAQGSNLASSQDDDFEQQQALIDSMNGINEDIEVNDPFENVNRKIFVFNDVLDRYFFQYVAKAYSKTPDPIKTSVSNVLSNLYSPVSIVNSLFQGNVSNALSTTSSFVINSTIGVLGIFDVSSKKGILYNNEDFGQTLGKYGVSEGPYIVLPFIGASTMRDLSGSIFDKAINPIDLNLLQIGGSTDFIDEEYRLSITAANAVSQREKLIDIIDDVRKSSVDPYSTLRSAYLQSRKQKVSE